MAQLPAIDNFCPSERRLVTVLCAKEPRRLTRTVQVEAGVREYVGPFRTGAKVSAWADRLHEAARSAGYSQPTAGRSVSRSERGEAGALSIDRLVHPW